MENVVTEITCPLMQAPCLLQKCGMYLVLNKLADGATGERTAEGRCAIAWVPTLLIELRDSSVKKPSSTPV